MKHHWYIFRKGDILLHRNADGKLDIPYGEHPPIEVKPWTTIHTVTPPTGIAVRTFAVESPVILPDYEMIPLRQSFHHLSPSAYLTAGKCSEIIYWDVNTRFCGVCGGTMKKHTDISKRCEHCGKEVWPQLATAVICLISRGDDVLLVHANNFKTDMYGLVAGFVETGETLEEAVAREAMEETGIRISNLRYFGSQPWPYPCGLMIGFMADYAGGELHLQKSELSRGGWFRYDRLPMIPEKMSIARQLIDAWLQTKPDRP